MKALVQDVDVLRALRPHDVAAYLRARGWSVAEVVGGFTRYSNGASAELEVPRDAELRDFPLRMAEVLSDLTRVENRSQLEIVNDIRVTGADVIRLRLLGGGSRDGTVTLEDGAMLVERLHDVLLASACATVQPRPYFGTRKPTEATEYVRKLRLGQTEHGSFVFKVLSPVSPLLSPAEAGDLFPESLPLPFERRVSETLMTATSAANAAAVDAGATGSLAPFDAAVASGASANLCEGLAAMLADRQFDALEISIGWAGNRPPPQKVDRVVRLSRETAPLLTAASQELKARAPREDFELEGYVVALDNANVLAHGGTITIAAAVDTGTRRVRVGLGPDDYRSAIDAHSRMARVGCSGRLVRTGRQYELKEPRGFAMLGDE